MHTTTNNAEGVVDSSASYLAPRHLRTEQQEAERLNVSVRTLQAWRYKGGGPPFFRLGTAIRYDPAAVDSWLEDQIRSSTSDPGPETAR